jgi:hypothetical protein
MKRALFAVGIALLASTTASAVPVLQLDIAGGSYDAADETIVTSADSFTVYAYATPTGNARRSSIVGRTYYLSIALTPETRRSGADLGSFTVNGTVYDATADMTFGVPPIEASGRTTYDGGDLARHGIYSTHFVQIPFTFSAANRSGEYNTADDPGSGPIAGNDMYFAAFTVDKSLLADTHQLHFDLFSVRTSWFGDRDIDRFAPFSHDAATVGSPVPEPTAALIFGGALLLTKVSTRRRG